jgi:hypothetical protein
MAAACFAGLALAFCRVESLPAPPSKPEAPPKSKPSNKPEKPRSASLPSPPTSGPSFSNVRYGNFPSPCSPQFAPTEPDGIKIAAPGSFAISPVDGGAVKLPFCVTLRFNSYYLSRFEHATKAINVVIVDDASRQVASGGIWRDRHYIPEPPPEIPREELEKRIQTVYATVNLLEFLPLPARKARYHIYALLEHYKSNVVTIDVVPE